MAQDITLLQVFISSPSDRKQERDIALSTINQLNRSVFARLKIRLEAITWESHASPDFATRPQEVINRQLDEWDIYVGILGSRFGTPTGAADCGTEEEFRRAYERWRSNKRSCRLMLYFSEALVSPADIDPDQLSKVKAFRNEVGGLGSLYFTYLDVGAFGSFLHDHLIQAATDRGRSWGPEVKGDSSAATPIAASPEQVIDESPTLLDSYADMMDAAETFTGSLTRFHADQELATNRMNAQVEEVRKLAAAGRPTPIQLRNAMRSTAAITEDFGAAINRETPILRQSWNATRESALRMLALSDSTSPEVKDSLQKLKVTLSITDQRRKEAITAFESGMKSIQPLSQISREVRRGVGSVLAGTSTLVSIFDAMGNDIKEIIAAIDSRLSS